MQHVAYIIQLYFFDQTITFIILLLRFNTPLIIYCTRQRWRTFHHEWKILISTSFTPYESKIKLSLTTERLDFNYSNQKRAYSLYLYALQWPWRAGTFPSWTSEGCSVCKLGVGASGGRRKLRNSRCIIYPAVDTRQHASSRW